MSRSERRTGRGGSEERTRPGAPTKRLDGAAKQLRIVREAVDGHPELDDRIETAIEEVETARTLLE